MFYKFVYGIIVPLLSVFISNVFDMSFPYSVIFMGVFTGVAMALLIRRNLFIYTSGSFMVLLLANYFVVYYKYGDRIFGMLTEWFGNIFVIGVGLLALIIFISSIIVYFFKNYLDSRN